MNGPKEIYKPFISSTPSFHKHYVDIHKCTCQ
uniref:Uncharacterized protein n=1 Tax=Anguilla anguilla TaxID=7936 RepID=A0A0E9TPT9_ANGAN